MKILHLTTFLQGGAGRAITSLAVAQQRAGHHVLVVTSRTGPAGYGNYDAYIDELSRNGVTVHLVDSMFTRDYAANLSVVRLLDRVVAAGEEPDVIHAHAAIPSLVALLFAASRARSAVLVQTMHGWGVSKTPAQAEVDITLMKLVHRVAVPSAAARRQLAMLGLPEERTVVVPYGIDADDGALTGRDEELLAGIASARRAGNLVVASVGTIGVRKNQRLIVEAMRSEYCPAVFAVFVGDGEPSDLAAEIDARQLGERCRIHGYSAAARRIAAAADVLVLPSRNEGQPLSVLEAIADRVLVAVSDIPELVELIDDGHTGVVFRLDDAVSLALALSRIALLSDAQRDAMRAQAQIRYRAEFTVEAMSNRYLRLYTAAREAPYFVRH